jgi:hypothetical protein
MTDSCTINDNQQPGSLAHNMIEDLSKFLTSYLEPLKLQFSFGEQEVFLNEMFMINGCLSLFIYDKQHILDDTMELLNRQNSQKQNPFYAKIKFIEEDDGNYFGVLPCIEHNLIAQEDEHDEAIYNPHVFYHNYYLVLNELIKSILSDKSLLVSKEGSIPVDNLYTSFARTMANRELLIEESHA